MKHLRLYIASKEVDLNEDSLVVMNYTSEELSNPTIVKNSYSQQITIPSTPSNDAIFGDIYRLDRSTLLSGGYLGVAFNPLARTPFEIRNDLGEIVESGYVKLDSIKRERGNIPYSISLYGGLGSFFYSLSYNEEGDKLTLADLAYLDGSKGELDFNINAGNVASAWNVLKAKNETPPPALEKWGVLNFVPAYTGIPEDFDADKAVAKITDSQGRLSAFGLALTKTEDGKTYSTNNGYTLLNLGKAHTGEDVKELRSYLQRPAISVRRMIYAIRDYASGNGYGLSLDPGFFNKDNPYYWDAWMLLPPMTSIEVQTDKKEGTLSGGNGDPIGTQEIPLKFSTDIGSGYITINATVDMLVNGHSTQKATMLTGDMRFTQPNGVYNICCAMQLVAVTKSGTRVGSNVVVLMDDNTSAKGETLLSNMGYKPVGNVAINECRGYYYFDLQSRRYQWTGDAPTFEVSADNIESATLNVVWNQDVPKLYKHVFGSEWEAVVLSKYYVDFAGSFDIESFTGARTGTLITKQSLLRSDKTPIDYLISYAKTFGLLFSFDKTSKVVTLQARDTWYSGGEIINLSERIDYSQAIDITPNLIDARYLEFSNESEGAFVEETEQQTGKPYGSQRVDTGSTFNKETKTAISNNAYKGAAEVCRRSKYNIEIEQGGQYVPSVFVDADVKFTLYNGGEGKEFAVTNPDSTATITYLNPDFPTYDKDTRLQLHDKEGKPIGTSDVLVLYRGTPKYTETAYERYRITDDNDYMSILNEGKPCWNMTNISGVRDSSLALPSFGRYIFAEQEDGTNGVIRSLDFGIPAQLDIPNASHNPDAAIYARRWQGFLSDQYNVDTRIVRAKVDLRGYQVGERLLRNRYYYEGCDWVMNKIINYSLTSDAPVVCEFIRVQEKNNYKNGQNY